MWLEIELYSLQHNYQNVHEYYWIPVKTYWSDKWWIEFRDNLGFTCALSQEYYVQHLEFNVPWTTKIDCNMPTILNCLCEKLPKDEFVITSKGPEFCGTHIHYSFINTKDWKPVTYPLKTKTTLLYYHILEWYHAYFSNLIMKCKRDKMLNIMWSTISYELLRLLNNHNILINYDNTVFDYALRKIAQSYWYDYIYKNGYINPRYRPIIRSPIRTGKPFTMEIRCIANIVALDPNAITKFNRMVNNIMNMTSPYKWVKWEMALRAKLLNAYENLRKLYDKHRNSYPQGALLAAKNVISIQEYNHILQWQFRTPEGFKNISKQRLSKAKYTAWIDGEYYMFQNPVDIKKIKYKHWAFIYNGGHTVAYKMNPPMTEEDTDELIKICLYQEYEYRDWSIFNKTSWKRIQKVSKQDLVNHILKGKIEVSNIPLRDGTTETSLY